MARKAAARPSSSGFERIPRIGLAEVPTNSRYSIPELARLWRVLAHPDVRRTPRVSAFFDFITDEVESLRPILTGW